MKYAVALAACLGVLLFWAFVGATIFGWRHGGGYLWQVFIWSTVVAVWTAVVKFFPKRGGSSTRSTRDDEDDDLRSGSGDAATEFALEEKAYEQALSEVEGGTVKKGLWAKALEKEPSDENRRRAKYIGLRVRQILKDTPIIIDDWSYDDDGWFLFKCPECRRKQEIDAPKGTQEVTCSDCGQKIQFAKEE